MTLKPIQTSRKSFQTYRPLPILAAFVLSGSFALAQTAPPAAAPAPPNAPQTAPQDRRPPSGPGRGMRDGGMQQQGRPGMRGGEMQGHRSSRSSYHRGSSMHRPGGGGSFRGGFRGEQGGGFHGPQGGGMAAGLRIAPPGMWWKNPTIVQKLTLTPEQAKKMDDIFQASRISLVDLKASVEKQELMLEPMLSANPPDTVKTLAQIDKVAQARAALEKEDAKMLLGIRVVLTPDQWTKLHAAGPGGFGRPGAPGGAGAPAAPGGQAAGPGGYGGGGGGYGGGPRGPRGSGGQGAGGGNFAAPEPQP